jgi:ATP-dependent DNA helicase PIF1
MVDGEMFDKFNKLGQMIRKNPNKPFGGMQIIVTGDFFQLPPVTKGGAQPKFCFDAQTWAETISMSVNLTKVFRQKDQRKLATPRRIELISGFIDMLNEMRFGKLSPASIAAFKALARPIEYGDGIEPTVLFPRREDVDRANSTKLNNLNEDGWTYTALDAGAVSDPVQRAKLLANFMAPESLPLKIHAQVMLIKNLDESLVNGSMGIVIGFEHKPLYETDENGQYIPDEYFSEVRGEAADEKRMARNNAMKVYQGGNTKPNPVVRFNVPLPGGGTGTRDLLVEPDVFKTELPNGEVQASRTQVC